MNNIEIASSFVNLALKYNWSNFALILSEEVEILLATVLAAGFEAEKVLPGKLVGYYRDQDGSRTGETYKINGYCPYKIVYKNGNDNYHATGWLDSLLYLAREGNHQKSIDAVQREIDRAIPMNPIQLTSEGDFLREYPPSSSAGYFVDHTRDGQELSSCVGVHEYCNGWMDHAAQVTKTHSAIVCRACHLRILFLKEIKTYGDLRRELASRFAQVSV